MSLISNRSSMFRVLLEFVLTILVIIVARAVLTSVMKGMANASRGAFRNRMPDPSARSHSANPPAQPTGELHKDPVCGTYVAESTPFRRQTAGQTFYYCSNACREKDALVAR
jgi:hypothetical protein